ncbi:MAG TPA: DUF3037 domain-containing protein [Nocardioidaceae bacterium]|jgi:hypothetical protein
MRTSDLIGYQYVVLRCVPRVDREEFVNVAVVLYSQRADYLRSRSDVDESRLTAIAPGFDVGAVHEALEAVEDVCEGRPSAGLPGQATRSARFGFLTAPRSTVVQPGPIHGGLTADPDAELSSLVARLVTAPV